VGIRARREQGRPWGWAAQGSALGTAPRKPPGWVPARLVAKEETKLGQGLFMALGET
jgi:hypothetical protein